MNGNADGELRNAIVHVKMKEDGTESRRGRAACWQAIEEARGVTTPPPFPFCERTCKILDAMFTRQSSYELHRCTFVQRRRHVCIGLAGSLNEGRLETSLDLCAIHHVFRDGVGEDVA